MAFNVRKRGKLTYYSEGDAPVLSALVTEREADGDLRIYFAGQGGGHFARNTLGRTELVTMDPDREIPLVFQCWELWLREAGICQSIRDVDFIEMNVFGAHPKQPNPMLDPLGYKEECDRLRQAYARAYRNWWAQNCPDHGLPCRFTVHVVDLPDSAASYAFYSVGLLQQKR